MTLSEDDAGVGVGRPNFRRYTVPPNTASADSPPLRFGERLTQAVRKIVRWLMRKLQNPTDNTGYMPLKRHIALTVRRNERRTK